MGFISILLTTVNFLINALTNFFNPIPPSSLALKNEINFIGRKIQIPEDPVCIVGAGISGLNLANILQEKGYKVIVFEKKSTVGGKVVTFRIKDEVQVEMGPVVLSPDQENLIRKIREVGLNLVAFNVSDRRRFDPHGGEIYPPDTPTVQQMTLLENAVRSYIQHRSGYAKELEEGYLKASPDLFVSIWEWLSVRNLQILRPIFNIIITAEGYGALEDTPAIYALKVMSETLITLNAFQNNGTLLNIQEGMDVFLNRMAARLNVKLNSDVFHISREKSSLVTFFSATNSQIKTYNATKCYKVILAFPPLLKNVKSIVSDLSFEEKHVLQKVKIHKYSSGATHIPPLENTIYIPNDNQSNNLMIPPGIGEVTLFARQSLLKIKSVYSCYSWIRGDYNSTFTKTELDDVNRRLKSTVQLLSKDGKILYQAEPTEYFPHVKTNALNDGFYKKFDAIQGTKGLYYATTLLTFEILDEAIKMTKYIAQRYFVN